MKNSIAIQPRSISSIACDIANNWPKVNYAAAPYLQAMFNLEDRNSKYGLDRADDIIRRFLCNASSFRGAEAKRIKAELKEIIKAGKINF